MTLDEMIRELHRRASDLANEMEKIAPEGTGFIAANALAGAWPQIEPKLKAWRAASAALDAATAERSVTGAQVLVSWVRRELGEVLDENTPTEKLVWHALAAVMQVGEEIVPQHADKADKALWTFCRRLMARARTGEMGPIRKAIAEARRAEES